MTSEGASKEYERVRLQKTENAQGAMESMRVSDEQVKMVIHNGEATGEKLYQTEEERFLAKMKIGEVTVYVEYSPAGEKDAFKVHTAYSHKTTLKV